MNKTYAVLTLTSCILSAGTTLSARADQALATEKNCMGCHAIQKKILGPAYLDVATKYKDDKAAPAKLAAKIMAGGSGNWGVVAMPANPQVNEAEAKKLAHWVLGLK